MRRHKRSSPLTRHREKSPVPIMMASHVNMYVESAPQMVKPKKLLKHVKLKVKFHFGFDYRDPIKKNDDTYN